MSTQVIRGEKILHEGLANRLRGIDAVWGRLFLTAQRLIFESNVLNIQTGNTIISLNRNQFYKKGIP